MNGTTIQVVYTNIGEQDAYFHANSDTFYTKLITL